MKPTKSNPTTKSYSVWLMVERTEIEGIWSAHCLELDVVSQGTSVKHAIEMGVEATLLCVTDDLAKGLDPMGRKRAPPRYWKALRNLLAHGQTTAGMPELLQDGDVEKLALRAELVAWMLPKPGVKKAKRTETMIVPVAVAHA